MTDKIERITRSLAYMLRHQPERFDLEIDPFGFADLSETVGALEERLGEAVTEEDVQDAVSSGDRPRYEIDGRKIRALYGHSIPVEPGPAGKPPEILYVALPTDDVDRARRFGLKGGRRRYLHLALTEPEARESGRRAAEEYTVLSIRALDAWEEGYNFYDRQALWLAETVPTHLLEIEEQYDDGEPPVHARGRGGPREGGRGRRPGRGRGRRDERGDRGDRGDRGGRGGREVREERRPRPRRDERDAPREERPDRDREPAAARPERDTEERSERPRRERGGRGRGRGRDDDRGARREDGGNRERSDRGRGRDRDERPRRREEAPVRAEAPAAPEKPARKKSSPAAGGTPFGAGLQEDARQLKPKAPPAPEPAPEAPPAPEPAREDPPQEEQAFPGFGAGL